MADGTTSAVVYKQVTVVNPMGETWDLTPFDNYGKVIPVQYVDVDASAGNLLFNLPDLSLFNGVYNTRIHVNVITGGLTSLGFSPFAVSQQIGSNIGVLAGPAITGLCFVFEPVSATEWSWNLTL